MTSLWLLNIVNYFKAILKSYGKDILKDDTKELVYEFSLSIGITSKIIIKVKKMLSVLNEQKWSEQKQCLINL